MGIYLHIHHTGSSNPYVCNYVLPGLMGLGTPFDIFHITLISFIFLSFTDLLVLSIENCFSIP